MSALPLSRRAFLDRTALAAATVSLAPAGLERVLAASAELQGVPPEEAARDEVYWAQIQRAFAVDRGMINLNNGGVCPTPIYVHDALKRYLDVQNMTPAKWMWGYLDPEIETARWRLAQLGGCDVEEVAIKRNASEALEYAQFGLDLQRGDEVLTTDQDYPRMITTWRQRELRDGIKLVQFPVPTPPRDPLELARAFERNLTPRARVILVSHVVNITGQIFPVQEICRMAHRRGLQVICDGAHAFAHFPFSLHDLECDYYGTSLHKWLTAPIGTGLLYVRRERIKDLWPLMAAADPKSDNIRKFEEIGTHPAALFHAINEAVIFHQGIGGERKAARLHYLKLRWAERLAKRDRVYLRMNLDPKQSVGLGTVGITGIAPGALANHMWDRYKILVVPIGHKDVQAIRVTPNVYTTLEEVDRFGDAMEEVLRNGLPG
jgi:isopenicillin-N epimerase